MTRSPTLNFTSYDENYNWEGEINRRTTIEEEKSYLERNREEVIKLQNEEGNDG